MQSLILTYIPCVIFAFFVPTIPLSWAADHFVELVSGFTILAGSLAIALYVTSFMGSRVLAATGTSGHPTYDIWMGRELNPRLWRLDWKEFCELYPGLIGWAVLNLAFAHKQFEQTGQV
jgi:Delta14-sterol reductase